MNEMDNSSRVICFYDPERLPGVKLSLSLPVSFAGLFLLSFYTFMYYWFGESY
jgi:hypothetical protein